jgi:hypothetical protein
MRQSLRTAHGLRSAHAVGPAYTSTHYALLQGLAVHKMLPAHRPRRRPRSSATDPAPCLLLLQGLLLLAVGPAAGYVKNCTHGSSAKFTPAVCNCTRWCDPVGGVPHGYSPSLPNVYVFAGPALLGLQQSDAGVRRLLIGDSIANFGSGYAGNVRQLLGPTTVPGGTGPSLGPSANAAVSAPRAYPQGNGFCGSSFGVLDCAGLWLGEQLHYKWDVIHFNWGLHDVDSCGRCLRKLLALLRTFPLVVLCCCRAG